VFFAAVFYKRVWNKTHRLNCKLVNSHRCSQVGKGNMTPKFLAYYAVLCFEGRCPKLNTAARSKFKYLTPTVNSNGQVTKTISFTFKYVLRFLQQNKRFFSIFILPLEFCNVRRLWNIKYGCEFCDVKKNHFGTFAEPERHLTHNFEFGATQVCCPYDKITYQECLHA